MEQQIITIIGGTGFVGRYVVRQLARAGYTIRVIARSPNAALPLKTAGDVGQIVLIPGNLAKPESLVGKIEDSYAIINLVGILFEGGNQKFTKLHAQGAERLAQMASAAGVKRFIQVSALGVDKAGKSSYARSKLLGENAVRAAFPKATILRPSVIFGAEDNFFNQFARMALVSPALPLVGGGKTRFQPVYVGDVAEAIEACLINDDTAGMVYELGGPRVYSFRDLMEELLEYIHKKRALISLPFSLSSLMATGMELLPRPPLTRDQVRLLRYDNVVGPSALGFKDLDIEPTSIDAVVPEYLARYHPQKELAA